MAKRVFFLKGLPASGKSTYARKLLDEYGKSKITRVNKDDLRAMMHNGVWSKSNEKLIVRVRDAMIEEALKAGQHVIVDDTNLHPKHEEHVRNIAKRYSATFDVRDFTDVPVEECIKRNRQRSPGVPETVIRDMWRQFLKPEPPTYDDSLPACVIVDIDGTLAHMWDRGPYDWDRVYTDHIDLMVAHAVDAFSRQGHKIVLMSGRDGSSRELTEHWLSKWNVPYDELHMRAAGDMRKDSIVKRELFEEHVKDRFYPELVIDDRKQVVDMWRDELGLTVWQVAEGDF